MTLYILLKLEVSNMTNMFPKINNNVSTHYKPCKHIL